MTDLETLDDETPPQTPEWLAVRDRLMRAAATFRPK